MPSSRPLSTALYWEKDSNTCILTVLRAPVPAAGSRKTPAVYVAIDAISSASTFFIPASRSISAKTPCPSLSFPVKLPS